MTDGRADEMGVFPFSRNLQQWDASHAMSGEKIGASFFKKRGRGRLEEKVEGQRLRGKSEGNFSRDKFHKGILQKLK